MPTSLEYRADPATRRRLQPFENPPLLRYLTTKSSRRRTANLRLHPHLRSLLIFPTLARPVCMLASSTSNRFRCRTPGPGPSPGRGALSTSSLSHPIPSSQASSLHVPFLLNFQCAICSSAASTRTIPNTSSPEGHKSTARPIPHYLSSYPPTEKQSSRMSQFHARPAGPPSSQRTPSMGSEQCCATVQPACSTFNFCSIFVPRTLSSISLPLSLSRSRPVCHSERGLSFCFLPSLSPFHRFPPQSPLHALF